MGVRVQIEAFWEPPPVKVNGILYHDTDDTVLEVEVDSPNLDEAVAAIQLAVSRMHLVENDGGQELTRDQYQDHSLDWYTPNYIGLSRKGNRFSAYLDYKGEFAVATLRTLVEILREELERASVDATVRRFELPDDWASWDELEVWSRFSQ